LCYPEEVFNGTKRARKTLKNGKGKVTEDILPGEGKSRRQLIYEAGGNWRGVKNKK